MIERVARDQRALASRDRIGSLARRIAVDLHGLPSRAWSPAATAQLLSGLDRTARLDGVSISAIQPAAAGPTAAPGSEVRASMGVEGDDFEIVLRGRFRQTMRFLVDLAALTPPVAVSGIDLDKAERAGGDAPDLDATIRLRILRPPTPSSSSPEERRS
jgi:hypothetical protein